jgi:hypothetical protein
MGRVSISQAQATLETNNPYCLLDFEVSRFEDSKLPTNDKFDSIIASNLYHIELSEIPGFIELLKGSLNEGGQVYFLYRADNDDLVEMQRSCDPIITGENSRVRTMDDVCLALENTGISHNRRGALDSVVDFNNPDIDVEKVIEFILNYKYHDIPSEAKDVIFNMLVSKNGQLLSKQEIIEIQN